VLAVDANAAALEAGAARSANMVLLGALVASSGAVSAGAVFEEMEHLWGAKPGVLDLNRRAFELGSGRKTANAKSA